MDLHAPLDVYPAVIVEMLVAVALSFLLSPCTAIALGARPTSRPPPPSFERSALHRVRLQEAPKPVLNYFSICGRGELCRLICAVGEIEFEDKAWALELSNVDF